MSRGSEALARVEGGLEIGEESRALTLPTGELAELVEAARGYARRSKAEATEMAYGFAWVGFVQWCEAHGLQALPANEATVALYAVARAEAGIRPASIDLDLAAIALSHRSAGHPSPTDGARVKEVRSGIRRTYGTAQRQAAPLLPEDLRSIARVLPGTLAGKRDRAILLLGFALAARRSELAALELEDLAFVSRGLEVTIRRSKTDQEGKGETRPVLRGRFPASCPVRAVKAWIDAAGLEGGPLFRPINRHGHLGAEALTAPSIGRIVKRSAHAAGIDASAVSGHSLRAGYVTAAVQAGRSDREIMAQTGHRSVEMVTRYTRKARIWEGAVSLL